jgi:thiamine-monophosphate kinase
VPRTLGEFELIARMARILPLRGEGVALSVGDDAALLRAPRGELLAATVDEVVEGVHFDGRFTPGEIGWKALAVNLSDLAAMGARPLWALVALAFPREERSGRILGVVRGVAACARRHGVAVVGGNVSRAPALSLAITAVGAVGQGRALTRAGARAGDLLLGSGTFGDAALGLEPGAAAALVRRQRRPAPRLSLGRALAGLARAAVDVSDGLVQDLGHLCEASGVGASLEAARIPTSPAYRRRAEKLAFPLAAALSGGEDYELLLAVAPRDLPAARAAARRARTRLTVLGRFERGAGVRVLGEDGRPLPVPSGHDHLRAPTPGFDITPHPSRIRRGGR